MDMRIDVVHAYHALELKLVPPIGRVIAAEEQLELLSPLRLVAQQELDCRQQLLLSRIVVERSRTAVKPIERRSNFQQFGADREVVAIESLPLFAGRFHNACYDNASGRGCPRREGRGGEG